VAYGRLRRGGYPLGSGAIESANKFIYHVRLKRSGAWWSVQYANNMLKSRCARYNRQFDKLGTQQERSPRGNRVRYGVVLNCDGSSELHKLRMHPEDPAAGHAATQDHLRQRQPVHGPRVQGVPPGTGREPQPGTTASSAEQWECCGSIYAGL